MEPTMLQKKESRKQRKCWKKKKKGVINLKRLCEIDLSLKTLIFPGIFAFIFFLEGFLFLFNGLTNVALFPIGLAVAILAPSVIRYMNTELVLFEDRLKGKTGFLSTKSVDVPISKINGILVEQGIVGKLLGYKTIVVSTSSNVVKFPKVNNADYFSKKTLDQVENYKRKEKEKEIEMLAKAMKK